MYMHEVDKRSPLFCLNSSLRKASRAIFAVYTEALKETGLKGTQFTLLMAISGLPEATITGIGDFLGMDQTTVTRSVNLLKKEGLVEAIPGEDKRVRLIQLTAAGQAAIEVAYPKWLEAQTKVWDALGDETARQLLTLSEQVSNLTLMTKDR